MNFTNMNHAIRISDNLILESLDEHHAEELLHLVKGNRENLSQWLPWVPFMQTTADFTRYVQRSRQLAVEGTDHSYVIRYGGNAAGRIGMHYIHQQNATGAIGYWLGSDFEGKGIITTSSKVLLQESFTKLSLNRIELKCGTGNTKSAAVAERLGFVKEGIMRQAEKIADRFIDLFLYSLLKKEWEKLYNHK